MIKHDPTTAREHKFTTSNIAMLDLWVAYSSLATEAQQEVESEEEPISSSKSQSINAQTKDADVVLAIKSLAEESLQISELAEMERTYAIEVISLLKQLIEPLNSAFHIKPTSLSKSDSSIQDVVLTPQGIVCVMHSHGTINSRPLETFSTEILMRILSEVIPEAKRLLVEKRQKITGRVGSLEKIAREFRKVPAQAPAPTRQGRPSSKSQPTLMQQQAAGNEQAASGPNQQDALKATFSHLRPIMPNEWSKTGQGQSSEKESS